MKKLFYCITPVADQNSLGNDTSVFGFKVFFFLNIYPKLQITLIFLIFLEAGYSLYNIQEVGGWGGAGVRRRKNVL